MNTKTILGMWILIVLLMNAAFFVQMESLTGHAIIGARLFVQSDQAFSGKTFFYENWNLVSMPATPVDTNISSVFNPLSRNYTSIHYYDALDQQDRWEVHHRNLSENAVQDLSSVSNKKGYWVLIVNRSQFDNPGTISTLNQIPVYAGWNLIGYPSNTTRTITSAFSSINGSYSSVYAYYANDTLDPWKVYNPAIGPEFSDLTHAAPFYGYWVNVSSNATISITNV